MSRCNLMRCRWDGSCLDSVSHVDDYAPIADEFVVLLVKSSTGVSALFLEAPARIPAPPNLSENESKGDFGESCHSTGDGGGAGVGSKSRRDVETVRLGVERRAVATELTRVEEVDIMAMS